MACYTLTIKMFGSDGLWCKMPMATPTSFLMFDSYDMKSLWGKFGYDITVGYLCYSTQNNMTTP